MMAALYFVLMMWLPICRASTEEMYTIPDQFTLGPIEAYVSNFSCYECQGIVGEVTNCGESLVAEEDIAVSDTIPCNNVCTKAVTYKMDQKIYVTRNCSQSCDPGCKMRAGTGTCWYCCHGDLCNGARKTTATSLLSLVFLSLGIYINI
eukprot:XP_011677427.1 PREDICTED: uncharacterized protein LOC105444633 [Strongylocentrotus purpuratus]